jgi:hypothetical protein
MNNEILIETLEFAYSSFAELTNQGSSDDEDVGFNIFT